MRFNIISVFPEPGYSFKISFKVRKLIVVKINEKIFNNVFDEVYNDYQLNAVVATDSKTGVISVKGPDISKKRKMVDYAIWIPYKEISESKNSLKSYIDFLFIGIEEIFIRRKINVELLNNIKQSVEKEVLNNPEYLEVE